MSVSEQESGRHKVAEFVAKDLNISYELALPLAKRAVRVLGDSHPLGAYIRMCRKVWLGQS
jgi:hypothetical protein